VGSSQNYLRKRGRARFAGRDSTLISLLERACADFRGQPDGERRERGGLPKRETSATGCETHCPPREIVVATLVKSATEQEHLREGSAVKGVVISTKRNREQGSVVQVCACFHAGKRRIHSDPTNSDSSRSNMERQGVPVESAPT